MEVSSFALKSYLASLKTEVDKLDIDKLVFVPVRSFVKFNGSCLIKQNKFTFNKKILNIYIVYDLDSNLNNFDPILENCLFGAIKITKNSDIDNTSIVVTGSALFQKESFQIQQVVLVIMPLFLLWMEVVLFMLPVELTTFWYLEKVLHKLATQQFMQKKCFQLILVQLKKDSL